MVVLRLAEDDLRHLQEQLRTLLEPYLRPRDAGDHGAGEHRVGLSTLLIPESGTADD